MRKFILQSLPTLLILGVGMSAVNADPSRTEAQASPDITDASMKAGRAFLDPDTGKLGPPPETAPSQAGIPASGLSAATLQKLDRSGEGLQARTLPDGTLLVDLQGRFQNFSVVTLDRHGEAHLHCNHSVAGIERALELKPDSSAAAAEPAP